MLSVPDTAILHSTDDAPIDNLCELGRAEIHQCFILVLKHGALKWYVFTKISIFYFITQFASGWGHFLVENNKFCLQIKNNHILLQGSIKAARPFRCESPLASLCAGLQHGAVWGKQWNWQPAKTTRWCGKIINGLKCVSDGIDGWELVCCN